MQHDTESLDLVLVGQEPQVEESPCDPCFLLPSNPLQLQVSFLLKKKKRPDRVRYHSDRLKFLKASEWLSKEIDATSARVEELEDTSTFDVVSQIPFILSNLTRQKIFLQLIYDRFNSRFAFFFSSSFLPLFTSDPFQKRYYFDSFPIAVVRGEELQSAFEHLSNKGLQSRSLLFFHSSTILFVKGADPSRSKTIRFFGLLQEVQGVLQGNRQPSRRWN